MPLLADQLSSGEPESGSLMPGERRPGAEVDSVRRVGSLRAIGEVGAAPVVLVVALAGGAPVGGALGAAAAVLAALWVIGSRRGASMPDALGRRLGVAAVLSAALAAPLLTSTFDLAQVAVLAIGALGLVLLSGYTGQISVAQGTFAGVGAYVTAVLSGRHDLPELATLPVDVVVGALIGLVVGIPSARLRGVYQVMTTLAVAVAFPPVIVQIGNVVGGSAGLVVAPLDAGSLRFGAGPRIDPTWQGYLVCLLCLVLVWIVLARLTSSHHGAAMRAIRQNEIVAAVNGVAVARYRVVAFVLSAAIGSLAGGLSAITVGAVAPQSFGLLYSIEFLVIVAVGGAGALGGAVVGSIGIFLVTTEVQGIQIPHTSYIVSDEVVYGAAVLVVLLLFEGGLWGAGCRALTWCARSLAARLPSRITAAAVQASAHGGEGR